MEGVTAVTHSRGETKGGDFRGGGIRIEAALGLAQPRGSSINLGERGKVNTATSVQQLSRVFGPSLHQAQVDAGREQY